jgi:hypothetical protein
MLTPLSQAHSPVGDRRRSIRVPLGQQYGHPTALNAMNGSTIGGVGLHRQPVASDKVLELGRFLFR